MTLKISAEKAGLEVENVERCVNVRLNAVKGVVDSLLGAVSLVLVAAAEICDKQIGIGKANVGVICQHSDRRIFGIVFGFEIGNEIVDKAEFYSSASIPLNQETILVKWEKVSKVEQTIGVPFLCELPILKYIFGTTTSNTETVYVIVTARVNKVNINEKMPSGKLVEFDDIAKK